MRKNDAGLTILEDGDVVRIGKGKVLYTVEWPKGVSTESPVVSVRSHNTDKLTQVERDRLFLVQSVQDVAYEAGCDVDELNLAATEEQEQALTSQIAPVVPWPSIFSDEEKAKIMRDVDGEPEQMDESTSYQKAILFALNSLGKHIYAGTAKNRTKRARRKLAKQARRNSRKARTARFIELSNAEK